MEAKKITTSSQGERRAMGGTSKREKGESQNERKIGRQALVT